MKDGQDLRSEERSENVANEAANTVDSKDIKRIVATEEVLQLGSVVAESAADDTEDNRSPSRNETGSRSNCNETSNDARAETNGGPLLFEPVVDQAPGDTANTSSQVGNNGGHHSAQVRGTGRTSVEAEPTDPEEDCTDDDVGDVVGTVVQLLSAMTAPLAEHVRVGQGSATRSNVDGGTSSKVNRAHGRGPSRRVPGPAGDGVVDDGRPDEHVDDTRKHASTLRDGTDGKSNTAKDPLARLYEEEWNPMQLT